MKQSTNYGFNIPEPNDALDVEVIGQTIEQIDEEINNKVDKLDDLGLAKIDYYEKYKRITTYNGDTLANGTKIYHEAEVPLALSVLKDDVGYLKITDVKDYVIEQGIEDNVWRYQKWNSGKIELWAMAESDFTNFGREYSERIETGESQFMFYYYVVSDYIPLVKNIIYAKTELNPTNVALEGVRFWTSTLHSLDADIENNVTNKMYTKVFSKEQISGHFLVSYHIIGTWK